MKDISNNKIWDSKSGEAEFYTDEDGKFKFEYRLEGMVDPHEYSKEPPTSYAGGSDPWPNIYAPNTLFRICTYKYRSSKPGWGGDCDKVSFSGSSTDSQNQDPLKGRIFWMGPAYGDITPEVEYGFMNGNRYTFTVNNVRDIYRKWRNRT